MSSGGAFETGRQRFGYIVDRMPHGSGRGGRQGTYVVRDADTGTHHSFMYADIVTEGFRTIRTGERVRFLVDPEEPERACYVIRLDLPSVEDYYR
ncbi:hypothetical protein Misp01_53510 [Microtetraspora sp. NBRC 13810]|uniref:hypothetical protein n=1 Tax=Microtetraspora sp. NBRC 13810 TaxID=3030990 RepID=UPI002554F36C|nr:hypothetical protein [Microtetraspora sp. NBRC 13810]GLW10223.1 hypothetical protein Misp01_53510 [Microtetraspora sp. NBRC 13810]